MYATVIAKGVTDFANNSELLKYGLHWDAVISRWANEFTNEVGVLEVLQKIFHTTKMLSISTAKLLFHLLLLPQM